MVEWLTTYWLEVAFGLVLGLIAWGGKKLIHFYIDEMKRALKATEDNIWAKVEQKDKRQDQKMDELRAGLLSIQGRAFKEKCHDLLESTHIITVEELENIAKDHDAYKGLGGNHEGDTLFNLIIEKAKKDIAS